MLRQQQQQQQITPKSPTSLLPLFINDLELNRSLLLDIVHENHLLYHMEKRDQPNNIIRVLVELYKLGATQEQLSLAYQKTRDDVESIRLSSKINEKNWEEYLGTSSLFVVYLVFFDQQFEILGQEQLLQKYFYSISTSIGSQLQPLVQLAFGIEHSLPYIITQALAYYATSYLDVSQILEYCKYTPSTTTSTAAVDKKIVDKLLFDLIRSDQRFDGKIEGNNTFQSSVKLLLKSKSDLIKTYMTAWSNATVGFTLNQRVDALTHTATTLTHISSSRQQMDRFLAGGQFIDAGFAIKKLVRSDSDANLVNLLFLSMLCTFVVQGRPPLLRSSSQQTDAAEMDWNTCISTVVQSSDPKSILALTSILKVNQEYNDNPLLYLQIANTLAQFVFNDGTWIKGGIGWLN